MLCAITCVENLKLIELGEDEEIEILLLENSGLLMENQRTCWTWKLAPQASLLTN